MENKIIIDFKIPEKAEEKMYSNMKKELFILTNEAREKEGLNPLCLNETLNKISQIHSDGQFECMKMSHSGCSLSDNDKETLRHRIDSVDYSWSTIGENVAYGYIKSKNVFEAWMESPGHRANILNPNFKEIGIGIKGNFDRDIYWTQVFGTPYFGEKTDCEKTNI